MSITERIRAMLRPTMYHISVTPEAYPMVDGMTARSLYATQANLHAVVSFLSSSIAQLPLKVYTRKGETDRERDRKSVAAKLLWQPNADQTAYELIEGLTTELFLMGMAVLWVIPDAVSASGYQLRIIPQEWIMEQKGGTSYAPDAIRVSTVGNGAVIEIPKEEFVMFRMYNPGNPGGYQSPIAALRQTLTEQVQADKFRTEIWRSSGRFNAYITRPKDVQPWDDGQRTKFVTAFREAWGKGGENAGKMPLLEDGMEIKPYQFNAKEAQYAETKQLSREDVAAAYHVNPSLIWHTNTQTYASAKDNARALYADCLGPVIQMIQQRINSFLLPMIGADPGTYVEFDLAEKLKGSFEERANIIQSSVGGPWMTRNEARADNNLPPIDGGDELIVPLNVIEGGQASPQDTHMDEQKGFTIVQPQGTIDRDFFIRSMKRQVRKECDCPECKSDPVSIKAASSEEEEQEMSEALLEFFKRQARSVLPKIGADSDWWDEDRWNAELADDIEPLMDQIADSHGKEAAETIGSKYFTEQTRAWLRACAEGRAKAINDTTRKRLGAAIEDDDEENSPQHVFEVRESDSEKVGRKLALDIAGWAIVVEAVNQARQQGIEARIQKRWVTGDNPRPEHAAMNGETVDIDEAFSNGCEWPGDDNGDPDTTCGCNCSTEVIITA